MTDAAPLFPDLRAERAHLVHARACRDRMVERLRAATDQHTAADEITQEYIELTVAEAVDDLAQPGAGDFFGRIDEETGGPRWYVGRRHIEDEAHEPVVIDWRAAVAAPFYRATVADALGIAFRRRFTLTDGELVAYLDEHLDDPHAADVAGGIPDPVLAEMGAARTGAMRDIVATIQGEQDRVIRSPLEGCLVVQGGPGTGKTAVGLHRAAFLLFEHRRRLGREGVLVVGPNRVFLDYIANVLPSLGERSVQQRAWLELAVPKVPVTAQDDPALARLKGDARLAAVIERAALGAVTRPQAEVRVPVGARSVAFGPEDTARWIEAGLASTRPLNRRREGFRLLARQEVVRRTGRDDAWSRATALRQLLDAAWPRLQPRDLVTRLLTDADGLAAAADGILDAEEQALLLRPRRRAAWTDADQLLVEEANGLLNGPPAAFGHVVVDEAQDLSALALRMIARRCPSRSFTVLGDLAQSSTPAGQSDWDDVLVHLGGGTVEHLTIGYRVPAPVLELANRLLPLTGVTVPPSRSARHEGPVPAGIVVATEALAGAVAAEVDGHRKRALTGIVAPNRCHEELTAALAAVGWRATGHVQALAPDEVPLFTPEAVKGLEFDVVVVVNPAEILDQGERGARLLYVAMTRAVQTLVLVGDQPLPAVLTADAG